MSWIFPAIQAGVSILGATSASAAGKEAAAKQEEGGLLSQEASYSNAADVEALGALNAGAITKAAANNASMMREIGYANANAIAEATLQNLNLYKIQSDEEQRLHLREERWHAGEIRAMMSGTGIAVNSGSPMAYLNAEITAGIQERHFMARRDAYTMLAAADEGLKSSILTTMTANYNAQVTESNAALQASVAIAQATADAAAMRRQGDISAAVGVANAQAARAAGSAAALGAIGNAVGYGASAYQAWTAGNSFSAGRGSFSGPTWQAGYAGPK